MECNNKLVKKSVIHPGKGNCDYKDGTKVTFHLRVETTDSESRVLDDSYTWTGPVELIFGKQFKLEVLEACLHTMLVGEMSSFTIDKSLLSAYPIVTQTMRNAYRKDSDASKKPVAHQHRCCGGGFKEGLGYQDLDDLVKNPEDLRFTLNLLKVDDDGAYEKDFWAMSHEEQLASIPVLQDQGNKLYREGDHYMAGRKYAEAIGRLEKLMLREKPHDEEWDILNHQKLPLLLNYAQCQLLCGEYYSVIEHCSTVLNYDKDNVKALFRRGKAYVEVFSPDEARLDLEQAAKLDPSIAVSCKKLLKSLDQLLRNKDENDKAKYKKLFS